MRASEEVKKILDGIGVVPMLEPAWCADCHEELTIADAVQSHRSRGHHVLATGQGFIEHLRRLMDINAGVHRDLLDLRVAYHKLSEQNRKLRGEEEN